MTRALVTGSTGCVGANLVAALNARGVEVIGLRRKTSPEDAIHGLQMTPVIGDILDPESLRVAMEGVDWVFHVAAVSDYWHTPSDVIYKVNVEGTRNVLEAARSTGVKRVVFTSSTAALGVPPPGKALMDEHDSFNLKPHDFPYGHSKHVAEQVAAEFAAQGLHVVRVLPSAVLGPRDVKFISGELLVQALKGSIPALPPGGLNYIDARDCAEGHIAAIEKGRPGERYILSGHNMTHRETMEIISQVLGTKVPRFDIPRWLLPLMAEVVDVLHRLGFDLPVDRGRMLVSGTMMYYDNSKAVKELGLRVRPFIESVQDTYQWYLEHDYLLRRRGITKSVS
jgi:dihydroflavonol-4-reductase